jgi:hypothetical protein
VDAVTTKDGALQITLEKTDLTDASLKHNLTYKSGMVRFLSVNFTVPVLTGATAPILVRNQSRQAPEFEGL